MSESRSERSADRLSPSRRPGTDAADEADDADAGHDGVPRHDEGRTELTIGGVRVLLDGSELIVAGQPAVQLSDREQALLAALVERRGQVVPRTTLLRQVWGSNRADPHTLEVTVGRLRRRLGEAGRGLRAVPRRGYVLHDHADDLGQGQVTGEVAPG